MGLDCNVFPCVAMTGSVAVCITGQSRTGNGEVRGEKFEDRRHRDVPIDDGKSSLTSVTPMLTSPEQHVHCGNLLSSLFPAFQTQRHSNGIVVHERSCPRGSMHHIPQ